MTKQSTEDCKTQKCYGTEMFQKVALFSAMYFIVSDAFRVVKLCVLCTLF